MARKINVLLVDDSRTVLAQLERLLGDVDDLAIVGTARDGAAAIRMATEAKPDLVLLDVHRERAADLDDCGWHRGYFGMQVNSPEERRIIFSVWDRGNEPTDPNKVDEVDRVRLVAKGDGVFTGRFGNEGTGGHSHLKYPWKTGSTQKFLVTATPTDDTHTRFTGYYFHPDRAGRFNQK